MFELPFSEMFHVVDSILSLFGNVFGKKPIVHQLNGSIMLVISTERCFRLDSLMIL